MSRTNRRTRLVIMGGRWCEGHAKSSVAGRDGSTTTPWSQVVKQRTNEKRRAYWRKKQHEIFLYGDADVANMEKLYLGEIWFWD
jgi:hypothetical protein